jgi:hypothetical protein
MNISSKEFYGIGRLANLSGVHTGVYIRPRGKTPSQPISKRGAGTARHWAAVLTITQCRHNVSVCDGEVPASRRLGSGRVPVRVLPGLSLKAHSTSHQVPSSTLPNIRPAHAVILHAGGLPPFHGPQRRPVRFLFINECLHTIFLALHNFLRVAPLRRWCPFCPSYLVAFCKSWPGIFISKIASHLPCHSPFPGGRGQG